MLVNKSFKILNKEIKNEKDFWSIRASHDAYSKSNGVIYERTLQCFHERCSLEGCDKLVKKAF